MAEGDDDHLRARLQHGSIDRRRINPRGSPQQPDCSSTFSGTLLSGTSSAVKRYSQNIRIKAGQCGRLGRLRPLGAAAMLK